MHMQGVPRKAGGRAWRAQGSPLDSGWPAAQPVLSSIRLTSDPYLCTHHQGDLLGTCSRLGAVQRTLGDGNVCLQGSLQGGIGVSRLVAGGMGGGACLAGRAGAGLPWSVFRSGSMCIAGQMGIPPLALFTACNDTPTTRLAVFSAAELWRDDLVKPERSGQWIHGRPHHLCCGVGGVSRPGLVSGLGWRGCALVSLPTTSAPDILRDVACSWQCPCSIK